MLTSNKSYKYKISVIVCTYNREKYIGRCVESFLKQTGDNDDWELVLVNNNSTDQTHQIILSQLKNDKSDHNVNYIIEKQQGLSYARNRGIKESKGEYLIFIDDDAFASPDYISGIIKSLKETPEICAFGGKIEPFLECPLPEWMSPFLYPTISILDLGDVIKSFPKSKYPVGANMGFHSEIFNEVGHFDVTLGRVGKNLIGGEEKDIYLRIKEKGYPIYYFPLMLVSHVIPETRLQLDFLKRLGIGVGISERLRTLNIGVLAFIKRLFIELYKWAGTMVLAIYYYLKLQFSKGTTLLKYRWWITSGLLFKKSPQ